MTTEQIVVTSATIFLVLFLAQAAIIITRILTQSSKSQKLAQQCGYGFWKGYPALTGRYMESRLFYSKLYVNACFIDSKGAEVGVTSNYHRYMTMMVGPSATESLYIDSLKDNDLKADGRGFAKYMYDRATGEQIELEPVVLEGDFYKHFNVLQPVGQQIETLSVLTPDVMAKLIDMFEDCNIEINKGRLTVFMPADSSSRTSTFDISFVQALFEKAQTIRDTVQS